MANRIAVRAAPRPEGGVPIPGRGRLAMETDDRARDDLAPARGILLAVLLGLTIWALLGVAGWLLVG